MARFFFCLHKYSIGWGRASQLFHNLAPGDGEPKPPAVVCLPVVCNGYGRDGAGATETPTPEPTATVVWGGIRRGITMA